MSVTNARTDSDVSRVLRRMRDGDAAVLLFHSNDQPQPECDSAFRQCKQTWRSVEFVRVCVDGAPQTRHDFNVMSVPTLVVVCARNGRFQRLDHVPGPDPSAMPTIIYGALTGSSTPHGGGADATSSDDYDDLSSESSNSSQ